MAEDRDQSSRRNDSWNEFNELTLNVMANQTRYDKCKKTIANTNDALAEIFNTEKQYYKERIIAMTRGLFDEESENAEINEAHRAYLKASIAYLKWNDITEMVETDTRSEVWEIDTLAPARSSSPSPSHSPSVSPPSPFVSPTPAPPASSILSFANKMCIRKKSMDDFIVIRPSEENSDEKIQARLPKIRDYQNEILKRATLVTRHGGESAEL